MTKGKKILLCVCMSLIGLILLLATYLNGREIDKFETQGTLAKARVTDKEKEIEYVGKSKSSNNYIHYYIYVDGDSIFDLSKDYVDDERYSGIKKGDIIDVYYFKETVYRDGGGHLSMNGDSAIKVALEDAKSNRPSYYVFIGVCFLLGLLPFAFGRKKKE